jgi:SNF2 family DNA or RNA helicase
VLNAQVEQQAFERCHRLGQTQPVTVHRLRVRDTVEQAVVALQERKRGLANSTLTADLGALNRLNLEDLKLLFTRGAPAPAAAAPAAAPAPAHRG